MKKKKVALVLSGGAALGFAHIGVIDVLERHGVDIDIVVGTSMGGLVGGAYAAGLTVKQMKDFACKFKRINFFDVNFDKSGLFSGKGLMSKINKILPDKKIESLSKTFACVACDLMEEKEVVFDSGSLHQAVRATLSIPGLFVPLYQENRVLVDGGIINNLPEDIAISLGADIIISCDVLSNQRVGKKPKNAIETLISAINCTTKENQKHRTGQADILIKPDTSNILQMAFSKNNTLKSIKAGETEAEKHIDDILKLLRK